MGLLKCLTGYLECLVHSQHGYASGVSVAGKIGLEMFISNIYGLGEYRLIRDENLENDLGTLKRGAMGR